MQTSQFWRKTMKHQSSRISKRAGRPTDAPRTSKQQVNLNSRGSLSSSGASRGSRYSKVVSRKRTYKLPDSHLSVNSSKPTSATKQRNSNSSDFVTSLPSMERDSLLHLFISERKSLDDTVMYFSILLRFGEFQAKHIAKEFGYKVNYKAVDRFLRRTGR